MTRGRIRMYGDEGILVEQPGSDPVSWSAAALAHAYDYDDGVCDAIDALLESGGDETLRVVDGDTELLLRRDHRG